jgi:hypothetical protein
MAAVIRHYGEDHVLISQLLMAAGDMYAGLNHLEPAEKCFRKALNTACKLAPGPEPVHALWRLGVVLAERGHSDEAHDITSIAMGSAGKLGRGHPLFGRTVYSHCLLLRDRGKRNSARGAAQQFVNTVGHSNGSVLEDFHLLLEELGAYVLEDALGEGEGVGAFNALEDSDTSDDSDDSDDDATTSSSSASSSSSSCSSSDSESESDESTAKIAAAAAAELEAVPKT